VDHIQAIAIVVIFDMFHGTAALPKKTSCNLGWAASMWPKGDPSNQVIVDGIPHLHQQCHFLH
jgi:hypothetical protein